MFGLGQAELLVILFILLLFFGPSKLPSLSKTLGESIRGLKEGFTDGKNDKSLKDITKEVSSSAREIKSSIADVKRAPFSNDQPKEPANEEPASEEAASEGQGYGQQGYGEKKA